MAQTGRGPQVKGLSTKSNGSLAERLQNTDISATGTIEIGASVGVGKVGWKEFMFGCCEIVTTIIPRMTEI